MKKNKKKLHAQVDANPFDTKNMRPYVDTKEGSRSPLESAHQPLPSKVQQVTTSGGNYKQGHPKT